ncbi:MAG: class I SAM-dependent methyltransferase [Crenarchaeota archaeon]|nr:class I SAM-dependent methyltransferase [Thermoproteota archaeon]
MSSGEWTRRYFVEQGELFVPVMESREMVERGKMLAASILSYLRKRGVEAPRILDVGCGTGRVSIPLAYGGAQVVGIDISPLYVSIARRKAEELGLGDRARFVVCDARRMSSCASSYAPFDAIVFVWTTVLGYYDRDTDVEILREAMKLSHSSTRLMVLDTASKDFISFLSNFVGGASWFTDYGDVVVVETPRFNPATGEALSTQVFYRKSGRDLVYMGEARFRVKLYTLDELVDTARRAGWCLSEAFSRLSTEEPYRTLGAINAVFRPC